MKNIAILVPCYNSVRTLGSTLRSILAQSEALSQHIALLMLSDDGSKDDTIALAESIWNHPTVPMIVKKAAVNQGEYRNVNGAIAALPPGIEWVLIMHSDNDALKDWIPVLARECGRVGPEIASICGSWQFVVDGKIVEGGQTDGRIEDVKGDDESIRGTIFRGCWWHNGASAIRVSAWKQIGGHPQETPLETPLQMLGLTASPVPGQRKLRIKGDWDALLRFLESGYTIRYVAAPLIAYKEEAISVSGGSFAWHGDLLETLQVMRRHQAVMSGMDILRFHWQHGSTLARRFAKCVITRDWKRLGFCIEAIPTFVASLFVSLINHERMEGGRLASVPYGPQAQ